MKLVTASLLKEFFAHNIKTMEYMKLQTILKTLLDLVWSSETCTDTKELMSNCLKISIIRSNSILIS